MAKALPDQAARHDISHAHRQTLFVEAGAGTGKTSSLVSRVLELLKAGMSIDNLAIITFTEAAAAELRDRVRQSLEATDRTPAVEAALAGLDTAAISTLHGFAKRVLSENLLEAGLPPAIDVLSELRDTLDFETEWNNFVASWLNAPDKQPLIERAFALGINLGHLKEFARILRDEWDRLPENSPPPAQLLRVNLNDVMAQARQVLSYEEHCIDPSDKMLAALVSYRSWLSDANLASNDAEQIQALASFPNRKVSKVGRAPNWQGALSELREAISEAQASAAAINEELVDNLLRLILNDLRIFTLDGVSRRKAAGHLRFHDLLVITAQQLRQNASMRAKLHKRYECLIIDEFQDTDPIQIEIARLITTSLTDVENIHWSKLESPPGSLFYVGDPKQAIYRFRRADIALFMAAAKVPGTVVKTLATNFRTVPGIIDWVNHVFAQIMGNGTPGMQPPYIPLEPGREAAPHGLCPVVILGGPRDGMSADELRRHASAELAAALQQAKNEGWPIVDRISQSLRAPRWDDMAVLLPTRTSVDQLRQAFDEANIPYRLEAASMVWRTSEVRDLINILLALSDQANTVALTAALRSDSFACSDDDLAGFIANGGVLSLASPPALTLNDPVSSALGELGELAKAIRWDEPAAAVERVIRECHLRELAVASSRPRDVWRRLAFVVDQARLFTETESVSLREFLTWVELQADEAGRQSEVVLPETDDDAVRVLTVHASKGLEFPIVALAGLNQTVAKGVSGVSILWDDDNTLEAQTSKTRRSLGFSELAELEREHEEAEAWRLMYVAATRARDHLIVGLHHPAKKTTKARIIYEQCENRPELQRRLEDNRIVTTAGNVHDMVPDKVREIPSRSEWLEERRALVVRNAKPSVMVPSGIAKLDDEGPNLPTSEVEPWRRGRAGTNIGRAVHASLQLLDFDQLDELGGLVRAQAELEGVLDISDQVEAAVRTALGAPTLQDARRKPFWRELYLASTIDGVLCEGYIDLLVEDETGFAVIDYKTDAVEDAAELIERYRLQAATYALLVEATLSKPVTRCVFILIKPNQFDEIEIPNLHVAKEEVRTILATNARRVGAVL